MKGTDPGVLCSYEHDSKEYTLQEGAMGKSPSHQGETKRRS